MNHPLKNDLFIRACYRQPTELTPVWMMRQAGRYLPQYRAVRKNHDFITMYKTPELAAEVTLQPVDLIGVDAAILFSDILVIPEAMGMELRFEEGRGPVFPEPLTGEKQLANLRVVDGDADLHFVMDAIRLCLDGLAGRVPLIGFSGAPWTLATYMIEGQGSKNFSKIKTWRFGNRAALHRLLEKVTQAVVSYTRAQIRAGAQAIQIFDTWAGLLDPDGFREFALPYVRQILRDIRTEGVPLIYFAKGAGQWLDALAECEADVLGLDWTTDIGKARRALQDKFALQGNLDPTALFSPPETIRQEALAVMEKYGNGSGHIFNLGHGILPTVPPEHARALIQTVKEESGCFHQQA